MPQWDFLNFIAEHAGRYPSFHLKMEAEVTEIVEEAGKVVGVRAKTPAGDLEVRADLTVGADGRHSVVRDGRASVLNLGAPMDVLWMRMSRHPTDPGQTFGRFDRGKILVFLNREDYWQMLMSSPREKLMSCGSRAPGVSRGDGPASSVPADRVDELRDWDDIKLLTVAVDRLSRWFRPGLLCIGDAAHAMSPIGGVGINLAIQDAVATANILGERLRQGPLSLGDLAAVQRRRIFPTRVTQRMQVIVQNNVIRRVLAIPPLAPPWPVRLLGRWKFLQRIPARVVGMGFRPEHVKTPEVRRCLILFCRVAPVCPIITASCICRKRSPTAAGECDTKIVLLLSLRADLFQGVEILGHQHEHHDVLRRGALDSLRECFHRLL